MPPAHRVRRPLNVRPTGRRHRAVVLVVAGLVGLVSCGVEAGDRLAGSAVDNPNIAGDGLADPVSPSAPTTTTPPPEDLEIAGADETPENATAANAVADLEAWWADVYPRVYGEPYEPLQGGLHAIDRDSETSDVPCSVPDISQMLDNAYYCPPSDAVVWDQQIFMPDLAERYGAFTVAVVIAHEWGHVVQERTGFDEASVLVELQADCFAGAWVRHVIDDADSRFEVTTDDLDQALAGILSLRDVPGGSADDPFAHGSGFDRVGAFQDGYEGDVERCAEYRDGDPAPYQFPFSDIDEEQSEGDLPLHAPGPDDDIIDLTFPSLDAYWTDTFPELSGGDRWIPLGDPVPFTLADPPSCGGETVEGFVLFVCIPDRFVGYEIETTIPAAYEQNGDFAVATLFATQYGLDVVEQLGLGGDVVTTTLRGDCFAGSWAAAVLPPNPPEGYELVLSPGDLDEAVAVLLSFRSEDDRARQGPGFDRVRAFRAGVLRGPQACTTLGD